MGLAGHYLSIPGRAGGWRCSDRCLNHRFRDIRLGMPRQWLALEVEVLDNASRYTLCMHMPASHVTPAPQSASFTQVQLPSHASQAPPQSTSVSSPSITPLLQLAGTQWLQCDEHWSLAQSTS